MTASANTLEPDRRGSVIYVGQDRAGHWLVQDNQGLLEGRFISRDAAWRFARSEVHSFPGAAVVFTTQWIVPAIPFEPAPACVAAFERAA